MPPMQSSNGRASKACASCRKRKTRCYNSGLASGACLRCSTLQQVCSLQTQSQLEEPVEVHGTVDNISRHSCVGVEARVLQLEQTVSRLTETLGFDQGLHGHEKAASPDGENSTQQTDDPIIHVAPLEMIRQAATETVVGRPIFPVQTGDNEILEGPTLAADETFDLLYLFQQNYGRWIAIPEASRSPSLSSSTNSSLLICACCLIATRHTERGGGVTIARNLYDQTMTSLQRTMLLPRQNMDFFRAVLVLSLWPTTIAESPLLVDSWLITGFAIQHCFTGRAEISISVGRRSLDDDHESFQQLFVWTLLCLSHLYACVGTRRRCLLDKVELFRYRSQMLRRASTNFERRMLAELDLYWLIYEHSVAVTVILPKAQAALQKWKQDWAPLFVQSRSQFLSMGSDFAQLLMYEQALKARSAAVRESLILEMVRLCSTMIRMSIEATDERTPHLTDHVYHTITFAAVTLCRLLCKYDRQIALSHDTTALGQLLLSLVDWLSGIGQPAHIGRLMAEVVRTAYERLPHGYSTSLEARQPPNLSDEDVTALPDFLDIDAFSGDWDNLLPDWQSFVSEEFLSPT